MQRIRESLLHWYSVNGRDLPWRVNKDPYRVWLSEIMLQQTRVEAVLPYYERFLTNFPTVVDLAAATEEKVTNLWAGLGYYSRARNLHKAAQEIAALGKFPDTAESLRNLPGIGEYTSAAIASICFNAKLPAIDGNLERVIARLLALKKNPKTEGREQIREFAASLVRDGNAGDINQSLMDLASSLCLPKNPRCGECPLEKSCAARKKGIASTLPIRAEKKAKVFLDASGVIFLHGDALLLAKRPAGEWLAGMWDIPWWIGEARKLPGTEFGSHQVSRTITNHKINFQVSFRKGKPHKTLQQKLKDVAKEIKWVKVSDLHGLNLPRPSEKALSEALRVSGLFAGNDQAP
jgi:A/G-specific adenine glycosylase